MKLRKGHIICKSLEQQLTLEISSGIWATILYALSATYFNLLPWFFSITKAISFFLAAYYFVYSYMLTKKITEKYFK